MPDGSLGFMLTFEGETEWNFYAASSDVMHDVKEKVSSDAKTNIKNAALSSGEDAVEAAGAEDGMTEVIDTMKVIKEIAQALGALDPTYVMKYEFEVLDGFGYMTATTGPESLQNCISMNVDKPGAANVVILGEDVPITADNADDFFVLSAFGTSETNPGFVDVSITPFCAHVCAAWNATSDWLDDNTYDACENMVAGAIQNGEGPQPDFTANYSQDQATYLDYRDLNYCFPAPLDYQPALVTVTDQGNSQRWQPGLTTAGWIDTDAPCTQQTHNYGGGVDSICGTCPVVKVATVPDAPFISAITEGNSEVLMAVTPGADNGAAITDYTATCTDGSTDYTGTSPTTVISVGGLTNGVAYTCTVISTNAVGTSPPSAVSSPVTPDNFPDPPTIDSITAGNSVLVITVTPGADNGAAITDYTAICTDGTTQYTGTSATTTITVGGLTNGVAYTCAVIATNAVGTSQASAVSSPVTPDT